MECRTQQRALGNASDPAASLTDRMGSGDPTPTIWLYNMEKRTLSKQQKKTLSILPWNSSHPQEFYLTSL